MNKTINVLTAVTGVWEAPLVSALESQRSKVNVSRRCVDLLELLSAATTGAAQAAIVSTDLRDLDIDSIAALVNAGVGVVALYPPNQPEQSARLQAMGVQQILPADASAGDIANAIGAAVNSAQSGQYASYSSHLADSAAALDTNVVAAASDSNLSVPQEQIMLGTGDGKVITVWGPTGAPGRTTVAVNLATELAELGHKTLLIDADTYGGCIAQSLGILDEAPGLAAACRAGAAGTLTPELLSRLAPAVSANLQVLTGINRSDRWPEISGTALNVVYHNAKHIAEYIVIDCGFSIERDEEAIYDTPALRRNSATLVSLENAHQIMVVGAGDPVGLQRLVRASGELYDFIPTAAPVFVINRVRASAVGKNPNHRIGEALARFAGIDNLVFVPEDQNNCDSALLAGRALAEIARGSAARTAILQLAQSLCGVAEKTGRRKRTG